MAWTNKRETGWSSFEEREIIKGNGKLVAANRV